MSHPMPADFFTAGPSKSAPAAPRSDGSIAVPPINALKDAFREAVGRWASVKQASNAGKPPGEYALARCQAALELLDGALDQLAGKKGDRATEAKRWLDERHAAIVAAIEAFESFGADFSGPEAQRLIAKITAVREAAAAADQAYATATHDTLEAALISREHARLADRDLGIEFARALASLAVPPLPSAEHFTLAEASTRDLERKQSKAPACAAVADAINQGLTAAPDVARLFVVYETHSEHALVQWRAKAAAEARGR